MSKENCIEEIRPHDSAYKHVSGFAEYTDDIQEPKGTLYGAIGLSKKAHAIIKKIDLSEVYKSNGVISVVTFNDIPGRNDVGPVFDGDPIFPKNKVEFYGQPLFAVAATSTELARKAVLKAKILYRDLKPIIRIKGDAIAAPVLPSKFLIGKSEAEKGPGSVGEYVKTKSEKIVAQAIIITPKNSVNRRSNTL